LPQFLLRIRCILRHSHKLCEEVCSDIRRTDGSSKSIGKNGHLTEEGWPDGIWACPQAATILKPMVEKPNPLRASIGIALGSGEADDRLGDLLRKADLALYRIKGSGKASYEIFDPDSDNRIKT
jgi:GGDEF domain-containing protein